MSGNPNSGKRKALIIFILMFLCLGGGFFLFMVFQGLGDMQGGAKTSFSYGFSVRNAALPILEYFGVEESREAGPTEATKKRIEERGLDTSLLDGPQADISDWMAKAGDGGKGGRPSGSLSAPPARTNIPKMSVGFGVAGGAGGGASRSSADIARFGGAADPGSVKISGKGRGGPEPAKGRGAIDALGAAQAALGDGLMSGSAMAAKSKWDQGFGSGVTGKKGGELAYGREGLVKLDQIKSGEIAGLKTAGAGSLKIAEPGSPVRDMEAESKANNLLSPADLFRNSMLGMGFPGGIRGAGSDPKAAAAPDAIPPKEVAAMATKPKSEGGNYCPGGCNCGQGCTFKDNEPIYAKNPDNSWSVAYSGEQIGADGNITYYKDVCRLDPGGVNPPSLVLVAEGSSPGEMAYIRK